jgi:UDP-N-acetylmuramate dehydrogenase
MITIKGKVLHQEPLAPYTSWHIGGRAKTMFWPTDIKDLQHFLFNLPAEERIFWLGLGSNVLIRDNGFDGTVIATHQALTHMLEREKNADHLYLEVEAGVTCAKIAKLSAKLGFVGGEFFAGIPGTIGGALAMNAGAWGSETWDLVESVQLIDRHGKISHCMRDEFKVSYRHVDLPANNWFISAVLKFKHGDTKQAQAKIKDLLQQRNLSQPIGELSCGSVFKNPAENHAAQLIDHLNLKGTRIGGAQVSTKHANFIINQDNAQAHHVEELILLLQQAVKNAYDVDLITEVRIIGD